jgi:TolB-like protein
MIDRTRYRFGAFELDPVAQVLSREGARIPLQDHPFQLLLALVLRAGELVSRDELVAALWPPGTFVDTEHGLNTAIRKLRRALAGGDRDPALLETAPRRGYRLAASVEEIDANAGASVAVLPFMDLSVVKDHAHLAEGLAEELIHALSTVAGLRIASRSAAFRCRDEVPERAGLKLGVRHVVVGNLRIEDDRCRIGCRLIEAASGNELWAIRFDRRLVDLLVLEEEIAREVVRSIVERLLPGGATLPQIERRTASAGAYDLYLRAKTAWRSRGHSILRAISLLERALDLDADYVPALQAVAACLYSAAAGGHVPSAEAAHRLAAAASRAFQLAPRDSASWLVEGMRREWIERRPVKAETAYREAIRRAPRKTTAYGWLALLLSSRGRFDEAIASARRGHAMDPSEPPTAAYLGFSYFFARRFEEAFAVFDPSPGFAVAWIGRAWILERSGRWDEALAAVEAGVASNETRFARRERVRILAAMGREEESQEAYEAIVESGALFPSFERGLLALARGDPARARAELEFASAERSPWMRFWRVDPRLDALREFCPGLRFPAAVERNRRAPSKRDKGRPGA